jgi:redox-sensitive bicupin YhaK (pirin superfamily)
MLIKNLMQRTIVNILQSRPTLEGAGVRLNRVFGYHQVPLFDPFLLLDHFGSRNPEDYVKGFPWHPHRGIETVTYMLSGQVEHGDSIGNTGVIDSGDLQWMTAGSGIIHQEMPKKYDGLLEGFQLWVNLPARKKMTEPRYRGITRDQIPTIHHNNATIKVIAGKVANTQGPVTDLMVNIEYFDVTLPKGKEFIRKTKKGYTTLIYVIDGSGSTDGKMIPPHHCVLFSDGDSVTVNATGILRFLFISGQPLNEPVAWGGPIVMNTEEELQRAFKELDEGTFVKASSPIPVSTGYYR